MKLHWDWWSHPVDVSGRVASAFPATPGLERRQFWHRDPGCALQGILPYQAEATARILSPTKAHQLSKGSLLLQLFCISDGVIRIFLLL